MRDFLIFSSVPFPIVLVMQPRAPVQCCYLLESDMFQSTKLLRISFKVPKGRRQQLSLACSPLFAKEPFVRDDRLVVNCCSLGSSQHGKTGLSSAISLASSKMYKGVEFKSRSDIDNGRRERENKSSENATHLQWLSERCRFAHTGNS